MADSVERAPDGAVAVRVLTARGHVAGAGVILGPDLVATCAHVVAEVLDVEAYIDDDGDPVTVDEGYIGIPVGEVLIDVVGNGDAPFAGHVWRWEPIRSDGTGDVALLRLAEALPPGMRMPPLRTVDRLWGRRFSVLGFPRGASDGVWSTGVFRAGQGTGWTQLQSAAGDQRIDEGFSGAPVWDAASGAVVGIAVAADRDTTTTTAYLLPISSVLGLDPGTLPNPYRGLEPFDEEHVHVFFGRDELVDELERRVVEAIDRDGVVAVVGPSGAGKSSSVAAGLVPRLRSSGHEVVRLGDGSTPTDPPSGSVVVIDQFEERVAAEPAAALEVLTALFEARLACVVLTLRPESLGEITSPEIAGRVGRGTVLVPAMERGQLRAAVVGPAERAPGLAFEDGLVDRILDEAGEEPGRLPLLGLLLARLWDDHDGGHLTVGGYERAGGVAGSVARQAEEFVDTLTDAETVHLRSLVARLARPGRLGGFVRQPALLDDLSTSEAGLLPGLTKRRLIVVAGTTVELAHQALIDHWSRLRSWLTDDRDFLSWRASVHDDAARWRSSGDDDGSLLRGGRLDAALDWARRRPDELSDEITEFVRRSRRRARRDARRWRTVSAVLLVLVLLAGSATVAAVQRGNRVERQLQAANAEALGRAATARLAEDPVGAVQFALAAHRADPNSVAAREALSELYSRFRGTSAFLPNVAPGPIEGMQAAPDGDALTAVGAGFLVTVRGIARGRLDAWSLPQLPPDYQWTASPDQRWVVAVEPDGTTRVWDTVERKGPEVLMAGSGRGIPDSVDVAADFSPDGTRFALLPSKYSGLPRRLLSWSVGDWRPLTAGFELTDPDAPGGLRLADDPRVAILLSRSAPIATPGVRGQVRAADTGAPLRAVPADAAVLGNREVSCRREQTLTGTSSSSIVTERDVVTGAETARHIVASASCNSGLIPDVAADFGHLVLTQLRGDTAPFLDLRSGGRRDGLLPPSTGAVPDNERGGTTAVVTGPKGEPRMVTALGRDLVRVDTEPWRPLAVPYQSGGRILDGGRVIVRSDRTGYRALDAATGAVLGGAPLERYSTGEYDIPQWGTGTGPNGFVELRRLDSRYLYTRFRSPDLAPELRLDIPGPDTARPGDRWDVTHTTERTLVALAGGVLSAWDDLTGERLAGPTPIGATPEDVERYRRTAVLHPRPGFDDQVVLVPPDGSVEIWSVSTPRLLVRVEADVDPDQVFFDPTGRQLITTDGTSVRAWDAETGRELRAPFPAPTEKLLGVTADGYLLAQPAPGYSVTDGPRVELWDLVRGERSGALAVPSNSEPVDEDDPVTDRLNLIASSGPLSVRTTAAGWAAHLCGLVDREFTAEELRALPPGTSPDRPCRDS